MVDKQEELLKFIKQNLKTILETDFPEKVYKQNKKGYFSDFLKNKIGIPRDSEVARLALEHLLKINYFKNKDHLEQVLQTPFFSKNVFDHEYYIQKIDLIDKKTDIDLGLMQKQEYRTQKIDELREEAMKDQSREINEIDEKIKERLTALNSIPSVLDQELSLSEPSEGEEIITYQHDPWWKRLGLKSDPFPTDDGLGNLPDSIYDRIVIMTDIYEKYAYYINSVPSELFKNTVFYGQFGSGKITLFEYLKKPLIKNNIYAVLVRLSAEPDYQNFIVQFKQKLYRELLKVFYNLTGTNVTTDLDSMSPDYAITHIFKLIEKKYTCNGFVIFIDNIYKPPDYERTALKFLNHLQTFKAELTQEMGLPNVGFFISAPREWEDILNKDLAYSGSVSREEHMPLPTVEQARSMLNRRLAAFAVNNQQYREIKTDFAHQVYRTLESRKVFTFRQFIKECLKRFESGNFEILTSNPVFINRDTLRNIRQLLRSNLRVEEGITQILESSMSPRHKTECFQLLIQIFNEKGYSEDSDTFKNKIFHFDALRKAGLIIKSRNNNGKTTWIVSRELTEFNRLVFDKYSYSLDDYFLKLFGEKLEVKKVQLQTQEREEFISYKDLIRRLQKKSDSASSAIRSFVDQAFAFHRQIISVIDTPYIDISYNKLSKDCYESIKSLSNAVASFAGVSADGIEFWKDFWHYPDSLSNFLKVREAQSAALEPNSMYLYTAYESVFDDMFGFLLDQIKKNDFMPIPSIELKAEEIKEFDTARSDLNRGDNFSAAARISSLVENKLRDFIYSVFLLQYGEKNYRMQRIPVDLHHFINDNIRKDKERGFAPSINELTYLNRHQYYAVILGPQGVGHDNWAHIFSKVFAGWDFTKMHSYLNMFFQLNLISSHNKREVLRIHHQSNIYQYIIDSIKLIVMINKSYFTFLDTARRLEIPGSSESGHYFSLDDCKDKHRLQPIHLSSADEQRIIEIFKTSKTNSIDLSCPSCLEQKYGIEYRELFAILATLIKNHNSGLEIKIMKKNDPIIVVQVK